MEEITETINERLTAEFGENAWLRYVDFDSPDLGEYPEIKKQVDEGHLQPGVILIESRLYSIWQIPYSRMVSEFEKLGARKISKTS